MRDLELWRQLRAGTATPAELDALAQWPIARRAPYLGLVVPLVEHADPALRAAALHVLAGCRGVAGLRAIVRALADPDEAARGAAIAALRATARDAPARYVHALFHPDPATRRAALDPSPALGGEIPRQAAELGVYLRADPACADLAAHAPWPDNALQICFDLHLAGHVPANELVELVLRTPPSTIRTFLDAERHRMPDAIDSYLDHAAVSGTAESAPGSDLLDTFVSAIVTASGDPTFPLQRALDRLVEIATPKKQRTLARRAAVSLLSVGGRNPALVAIAVALEPRVLGFPDFDPAHAAAATTALLKYRWPIKPSPFHTLRLLALPILKNDLALAAAIAGLLPAKRLVQIAEVLTEPAIVASLVASDHGWDEICQLPWETPPLEIRWLALVEAVDYKRYIALTGRAIGIFTGRRLERFVEQMPRRHREPAFIAALRARELAKPEQLAAVCQAIAARVDRAGLTAILESVLAHPDAATRRRLVMELVRATADKQLATAAAALDDAAAILLVAALDDPTDLPPRDRELAVARAYADRTPPAIRDWCTRVAVAEAPVFVHATPLLRRAIADDERIRISTCGLGELARALKPAFGAPVTGLTAALAARTAAPSMTACAALLGCADPIEDVARQLDRFANSTERFDAELDNEATVWLGIADVPALANARLYRWEKHTFALAEWLGAGGGVHAALAAADALPGWLARQTLWRGISEAVMFWRYRDPERYKREATLDLALFASERVDRDIGRHAARLVVALVEGGAVGVSAVRDRVLDRIADADGPTREYAARLVRLDGLPEPPPQARALPAAELLAQIRATTNVDELVQWCADTRAGLVEEAVLALLVVGAAGQLRLAELLDRLRELSCPIPILASILLWDEPAAIDRARALARSDALPASWQFHLCLALAARGEPEVLDRAIAAVRAIPDDATSWFFRRDDWEALVRVAGPLRAALELADARHHHAYQRAVATLLVETPTIEVERALQRFLDVDADRPLHLRRSAARRLAEWGNTCGVPLLAEEAADERDPSWMTLPASVLPGVAELLVDGALIGGHFAVSEKRMWEVLEHIRREVDRDHLAELHVRILEGASTNAARRGAARYAVSEGLGHRRLERVAEVFAWGIRRGVELSGRLFRIHMTSKERDLGHTRLTGNRIFVSPLPMLRGETHGQDVVEGLVLHEIGHHVYHRSEEAQALWERAHKEGVGHLLNLVADEHLERNLRALDPEYGDRLKRLGAYAFQHAPQEIAVATLLAALRGASARALIHTPLDVAFDEGSVRLRRGAVLAELDRAGHPLARFARALRMGLGNRSGDPKLAAALALVDGLRDFDMKRMYDITWQLANMFGGVIQVAQVFGGPEGLEFGEREDDVFGSGIDDDALQKEVDRILDPKRNRSKDTSGTGNKLWINVNPDDEFDRITHISRVRGNPAAHKRIATLVDRHAARLRALLDDLGLRWEPQKARTQGRALDRGRLQALVTRGDPRILVARTPTRRTDLFLGTIVDCSGSMQAGDNIDRARRFAVMVAEAVRPLTGVEARFFGFTNSVIYDAGDARDCGVVGLVADGGNNDAAALFHAANVAMASNKRAKVLVMISDGLPTECSVSALRGLVQTLTRRKGIVCAQVAVRALEEVCFPHYVVLDDNAPDIAVARFGRMIGDLARRSLIG